MPYYDDFTQANNLLRETFGYHISPRLEDSESLRTRLNQGGIGRFRLAVRLVKMQLGYDQIPNNCQEIHANVEFMLYVLLPYPLGVASVDRLGWERPS